MFPQELGHLFGSDQLDANGGLGQGVSTEGERRGDGVGGPVNGRVDAGEEGLAKDAIVAREGGDDH